MQISMYVYVCMYIYKQKDVSIRMQHARLMQLHLLLLPVLSLMLTRLKFSK